MARHAGLKPNPKQAADFLSWWRHRRGISVSKKWLMKARQPIAGFSGDNAGMVTCISIEQLELKGGL
jgi:hypothetical protein